MRQQSVKTESPRVIILGIDPGTVSVGYSILNCDKGGIKLTDSGLFSVSSVLNEQRLLEIHKGITGIIHKWNPSVLAVERLFFAKNQKTALEVAEARGVILLTITLAGLKTYEYTPLEVKKTVTGDGLADKIQMKKIIQLTLPETRCLKARDDVFDAIAVALTHYFKERSRMFINKGF